MLAETVVHDPISKHQLSDYHEYLLNVDDENHKLCINLKISKAFLKKFKQQYSKNPMDDEFNVDEDQLLLYIDRLHSTDEVKCSPQELKKV